MKCIFAILLLPTVTMAQQLFTPRFTAGTVVQLPAGATPSDLAIADFDRDNRPDFAVSERGLNAVEVYRQQPNGSVTFRIPGTSYAVGVEPSSVVAFKFGNQDLPDDLVAVSGTDQQLYRLLNSGSADGSLTLAPRYTFTSNFIARNPKLVTAYLDLEDGMDLVFTHDSPVFSGLGWRKRSGGFDFETARYVEEVLSPPTCVAIADMDSDGRPDALTNRPASNEVKINYGGIGGWNSTRQVRLVSPGRGPVSIVGGDVNADSRVDLAVANSESNDVSIILNTGVRTFGSAVNIRQNASPKQVLLQDLNQDNLPELITINADNTLNIYLNTGQSGVDRFVTPQTLVTGGNPVVMRLADFNQDGRLDIAVACAGDNTVRLYQALPQTLAAKSPNALSDVHLYPNPASSTVQIQLPASVKGSVQIQVMDALGRSIEEFTTVKTVTFEVGHLPRGVYTIRIRHANTVVIRRLILE